MLAGLLAKKSKKILEDWLAISDTKKLRWGIKHWSVPIGNSMLRAEIFF
jgi:hypothetical protein